MVEVIIHYINSNKQRNETQTAIYNTQNPDRLKFTKSLRQNFKEQLTTLRKLHLIPIDGNSENRRQPFKELSTQITLNHR